MTLRLPAKAGDTQAQRGWGARRRLWELLCFLLGLQGQQAGPAQGTGSPTPPNSRCLLPKTPFRLSLHGASRLTSQVLASSPWRAL